MEADMVRDDKHTEELKLRLTEREMLDLSRLAARDERLTAEFARMVLRRFMYGIVSAGPCECKDNNSPDAGR